MTLLLTCGLGGVVLASLASAAHRDTTTSWRHAVATEVEQALTKGLLDVWYPRVIDEEHGGYYTTFSHAWRLEGSQDKFIVTQARHVWTTAQAALRYPQVPLYERASRHGAAYLIDRMWDHEYGGFHEMVTPQGEARRDASGDYPKRAYGNAFAIYALAAFHRATADVDGLEAAIRAFRWLDEHAHDPVHGGYFQFMKRDGTPIPEGVEGVPPKDQNSSIHLLEAFTELYRVWPDSVLRVRLNELLHIIRDQIVTEQGYMNLFFRPDWTPVLYRDSTAAEREAHYEIDHVSFGHDVETAFLMLEASEALGLPVEDRTLPVAKRMVDHALAHGYDRELGGFYDRGYYMPGEEALTIITPTKNWWAQAEGLHTLLIMADLFPSDQRAYADLFRRQWEYIKTYLIDHEHGGWYAGGLDAQPELKEGPKAYQWKGPYHDGRALMNVLERLRRRTW